MILNAVDKTNLRSLKADFDSESPNTFCKITHFKDAAKLDQFKAEIDEKFGQVSNIKVS